MDNEIPNSPLSNGSCATQPSCKRYSAKELTEVLKTSPQVFMTLDLKVQTNAWNLDYIFEFLYHIRDVKQIDFMIVWFTSRWTKDKGVHNSFTNASDKNLIQELHDFEDDLTNVKQLVLEKIVQEEADKALLKQYEGLFGGVSETSSSVLGDRNQTDIPAFDNPQATEHVKYHLDDLPEDVKKQFLISNDALYSDFVETLKRPVKEWIDKHHKQDWNVVRFICRLRLIVARKCSMAIFGKFLEKIGLGNQESNMKQRKDANNDKYLDEYDDPKKKQYFWQLKKDGDAIAKELQSIIDRLAA